MERLTAAVADGKITHDEADALLARFDKAEVPASIDPVAAKAEARAKLVERLTGAVADGKLTRAEADALLARFDNADFTSRPGRLERPDRDERADRANKERVLEQRKDGREKQNVPGQSNGQGNGSKFQR